MYVWVGGGGGLRRGYHEGGGVGEGGFHNIPIWNVVCNPGSRGGKGGSHSIPFMKVCWKVVWDGILDVAGYAMSGTDPCW